ncbi:MAG: hypothetical protein BV456_10080, partial [Thermoplasmata archaeon M8B2D]
ETYCIILLILFSVFADAAELKEKTIYTIQTNSASSMQDLDETILQLSNYKDLWIHYEKIQKQYSVMIGVFKQEREAQYLLNSLKQTIPSWKIVRSSFADIYYWVPKTERVKLSDIGYSDPIHSQGFQSYASVQFPWTDSMTTKNGKLKLFLKISPLLNERSSIKVMVEKIPYYNKRIRQLGNDPVIEIQLDRLEEHTIGEKLDVEIYGYFSITDDRCADEPSGNLWMVIEKDSYLQYTVNSSIQSLKDYFKTIHETYNISIKENETNFVEASIKLAGFLGSISQTKSTRLKFSKISGPSKNIFIGSQPKDIELFGSNLYVTPAGIDFLINKFSPLLPFSSVSIDSYNNSLSELPNEISFEDLGYENRVMIGIGDLTASYPFSLQEIGGWPKHLFCTLVYNHTPIHEEERSFLKIKMNKTLFETKEVTAQGGQKSISFEIPERYLQPKNTLEVIFSYYLNRGDCKGSLPQMEVSIFKDSFLSTKGFRKNAPLSIGSYPSVFLGRGAIILSDNTPKFYIPIARLVEMLGQLQGVLKLLRLEDLDKQQYDYAMFHMSPDKIHQLNPMVDMEPSFEIINPFSQKSLLKLSSDDSVAVLQVFYNKAGTPILIYSENDNASPFKDKNLLSQQSLNGNVAIYKDNTWYPMEIGQKLRVVYPHQTDFEYYWVRYRLIICVLVGTLLIVFLFFIYHRLTGN